MVLKQLLIGQRFQSSKHVSPLLHHRILVEDVSVGVNIGAAKHVSASVMIGSERYIDFLATELSVLILR